MKTVILNDTRSADHVGCTLVMEQALAQCRRVGLQVIRQWTTEDCKQPVEGELANENFDCLLINGEGTMHHDRPVATNLCQAASWARARGKTVVLFNTLWEGNEALQEHLGAFDRIFCRDSMSAEAVRAAGAECRVVPDLIFGCVPPAKEKSGSQDGGKNELTVLDSIDRRTSEELSRYASRRGYPFLHMDRIGYERLKKRFFVRTGWYSKEPDFAARFLEVMSRSRRVLSGRFHGTCLAMVLGVPVVSIRSNTHKLEALYRDAGLGEHLVKERVPRRDAELEAAFEEAKAARSSVGEYVAGARQAIEGMFDEIAEVAKK